MKTSELTGKALNWAVGKAEGLADWLAPVNYCGQWEHGGPIIEREGISIYRADCVWGADITDSLGGYIEHIESAPAPLIAAMRCYVASKLGDNVDVPEELP
jgi:hypothetical protein